MPVLLPSSCLRRLASRAATSLVRQDSLRLGVLRKSTSFGTARAFLMLMRLESSALCDIVYLRLGFLAGLVVSGFAEETGFWVWLSGSVDLLRSLSPVPCSLFASLCESAALGADVPAALWADAPSPGWAPDWAPRWASGLKAASASCAMEHN